MSVNSTLALIFTLLGSVSIVAVIIILGWFLIWKAFLSKFRLVRELLGQADDRGDNVPHVLIENNQVNFTEDQQLQEAFFYAGTHKVRLD